VEVVDTGYAYHVKSTGVSKGRGLERVGDALGIGPDEFVAIGDSENDVSTFAVAGASRTRSPTPTAPLARLPISW